MADASTGKDHLERVPVMMEISKVDPTTGKTTNVAVPQTKKEITSGPAKNSRTRPTFSGFCFLPDVFHHRCGFEFQKAVGGRHRQAGGGISGGAFRLHHLVWLGDVLGILRWSASTHCPPLGNGVPRPVFQISVHSMTYA